MKHPNDTIENPRLLRLLVILAAVAGMYAVADLVRAGEDQYCAGYQAGYAEGYCHELEDCLTPTAPLCPLAPVGSTTWSDGFGDGFRAGYRQPFADARDYIDSLRETEEAE